MNKAYIDLVNQVRTDYKRAYKTNGRIGLGWCDKGENDNLCREINLWTYWQGWDYAKRESHIHILLLGQNWGNPYSPQESGTINNIRMMNRGLDVPYRYHCNRTSLEAQTDINLIDLFEHIGYTDIDVIRYSDLFFTNFNLGYRTVWNSEDIPLELMELDAPYIKKLIDILKPDKILCLGEDVVNATIKLLFGTTPDYKSFDDFLDEGNIMTYYGTDYTSRIYPLFHTCYYGTNISRKGGYNQLLKDWARILR